MTIPGHIFPRTFSAKFWCITTFIILLLHFKSLQQLDDKTKDNSNLHKLILKLEESHKSLNSDLEELENLDEELILENEIENLENEIKIEEIIESDESLFLPKAETTKKCWKVVKEKNLLKGREQEEMALLSKQDPPPNEDDFSQKLEPGIHHGCWAPKDCLSDQRLVVVIPYRHRASQLKKLLFRMHDILQRQRRTYCIVVSEQYDLGQFNRGKLMNTGYLESFHHEFFKIHGEPNCFAFHDVDLLPEDDRNLFSCIENTAVHLCDKLNKYEYHTQYTSGKKVSAGGSVLISKKHYEVSNGHSNWFWGWGVEDIDAASRIRCHTPDYPENASFNKTEDSEEYFKLSTGLTREGGDWGLFRQDLYGQMTQIDHKHGFTNGPAHSKLAVGNNFVTNIARSNLHYFRRWRVGYHQTYANENITKVYTSPPWDGHKNTSYKLVDSHYSKYFTKYTFDIRPAKILKENLLLNNDRIYSAVPEIESLHKLPNLGVDECQYMMYEDAFIDKGEIGSFAHDPRKATLDSRAHARLNYWSRLKNGMKACDDHFTKYYGQCNGEG